MSSNDDVGLSASAQEHASVNAAAATSDFPTFILPSPATARPYARRTQWNSPPFFALGRRSQRTLFSAAKLDLNAATADLTAMVPKTRLQLT
jgi:hypothetical protein